MSPSYLHSYVQSNLIAAFKALSQFSLFSELSLEIQGKEYVPDLCLYAKRPVHFGGKDILRMTELPLLAVEIMSPSQTTQDAVLKIETYLQNGVKSCWLVFPASMTVTVYASIEAFQIFRSGEVHDAGLDIRLPLDVIFA